MQRIFAICVFAALAMLAGCTEPAPQPGPSERALQDPMNYNPAAERVDVSGGGLTDFDKKAMRKDLNDVLNP